jgi:lipoprotein-releasing system permease protein
VHYPNADAGNIALNPLNAVSTLELRPHGIFKVQEEFDQRYVLATLPIVQKLFGAEGEWSSLEIRLAPGADKKAVQTRLRQLLGNGFIVETRYEQNRMLNSVMRTEKWATYVILLFVLLIASVNMIGAMSLLVLEKGRDMALLTAMGARSGAIRAIFLLEGMLWAAVGGGIGLIAGALLCLGQQRWGWIRLQGGFIIEAYPVAMRPLDFLVIIATVLAVGLIAAAYPAIRAGKIRQLAN